MTNNPHCGHSSRNGWKIVCALAVVVIVLNILFPGRFSLGSLLPILAVLACPLAMFFMMGRSRSCGTQHEPPKEPVQPPNDADTRRTP